MAFKAARSLFGEDPIGLRLPSVIGFLAGCLAIFLFARRRFPSRYAWCSALILFASGAFDKSYEARSYAIYFGIAGLALLGWQVAVESSGARRWLALATLTISLAAGISTHWFFILMLIPLCIGEASRCFMTTKRPDLAVWLAFGIGFLPLLFYGPLLKNGRDFSGSFWARPTLHSIAFTYREFLPKALLPASVALAFCMLPRALRRWPTRPAEDMPSHPGLAPHEALAALGMSALPIFGCLFAYIMHGGYTSRYVVPAFMGLALLATEVISRADRYLRLPRIACPFALVLYAIGIHGY